MVKVITSGRNSVALPFYGLESVLSPVSKFVGKLAWGLFFAADRRPDMNPNGARILNKTAVDVIASCVVGNGQYRNIRFDGQRCTAFGVGA